MAFKIVIGKCKKYNQYIGMQVNKTGAEQAEVLGFFKMGSVKAYDSQIFVRTLTAKTPCSGCHTTQFGSCACWERSCGGLTSRGCLTCRQMELDMAHEVKGYGQNAGINVIEGAKDAYGNVLGSQGDLGKDGAFRGKKVVVQWLATYSGSDADWEKLRRNVTASLGVKGFEVVHIGNCSANELSNLLRDACQYWVISNQTQVLTGDHLRIIEDFYRRGHGIYIWGDNDPFYADANAVTRRLFGISMSGNYRGDQVLGICDRAGQPGILRGHLLSTGIQSFYEGITIANIPTSGIVKSLAYSSDGKVVSAYVDSDYCRCLIDGGFTRLYHKWDSAGTERYVKNAAVWLANYERFFEDYED